MRFGYLNTIRWEPFPKVAGLAEKAAKNPILKALLQTGVPRSPQSRTPREEAIFLLRCAAEIEHSLLVQYLFSAYSLDVSQNSVQDWQATMKGIAQEEMGHLITVQNLLLAVGAEPYLDRQQLTTDPFPFQLEPFSRDALAKYVITESPVPELLPENVQAEVQQIEEVANLAVTHPCFPPTVTNGAPIAIKHVASLYAWLYWLFLPSDAIEGPWISLPAELKEIPQSGHLGQADFPGLGDQRQAEPVANDWDMGGFISAGGPILVRSIGSTIPSDKNSPLQVLFDIAIQGEGADSAQDSHFHRFLKIWREFEHLPAHTAVSLKVACAPATDSNRTGRTITHKVTLEWARLFNIRYRMLVLKIWLAMSEPRSANVSALRAQLIGSVLIEMLVALKQIAEVLTQLPLKPRSADGSPPTEFAGPPFELPDGALPNHAAQQKQNIDQLIQASKTHIAALRAFMAGGDPDRPTAQQDLAILQQLEQDDKALGPLLT